VRALRAWQSNAVRWCVIPVHHAARRIGGRLSRYAVGLIVSGMRRCGIPARLLVRAQLAGLRNAPAKPASNSVRSRIPIKPGGRLSTLARRSSTNTRAFALCAVPCVRFMPCRTERRHRAASKQGLSSPMINGHLLALHRRPGGAQDPRLKPQAQQQVCSHLEGDRFYTREPGVRFRLPLRDERRYRTT